MILATWSLEDTGHECRGVASAEEALDAIQEGAFDVVLMDISLPGMDGKEATRRLRADPRFAELPIIAVTAHAIADEEHAIRNCGVNTILIKPLERQCLLETIERYLAAPAPT